MPEPEAHQAAVQPTLRTLGVLHLPGSRVTRPKPLLVLAYVAHEGPTDRERLARLFFEASRDPRDALTTTLRRLGNLVDKPASQDDRVQAQVTTDALEFQRQAVSAEPEVALARYGGSFIQGSAVRYGVEVEEWILSTREQLASIARDLHLRMARSELHRESTEAAWRHAKAALGLTETFALEPEPTALLLQGFSEAGLPVPDGWWRTMATLGLDRRTNGASAAASNASPTTVAVDPRGKRRSARLARGSSRTPGLRRSRRHAERP